MRYKRTQKPGATFFFTVNLANRTSRLLTERIDALRLSIQQTKRNHPFSIDAIVVLPDHLHTVWTLPDIDSDYSKRWMLIKSNFSRQIPNKEYRRKSRILRRERVILQRRFWEYCIRDEEDFIRHVDYIHYNPVKHGYVQKASQWEYSSIHRYIKKGILDKEWGVALDFRFNEAFGES